MEYFNYDQGELRAEEVPLTRIAKTIGTPFYCYSTSNLKNCYQNFSQALIGLNASIFYAVKANSNLAVISTLAREGAGADVVSEGEIRRALVAGIPANRIVFSGVGKTKDELAFALQQGILQINVESEPELETLSTIANEVGINASIAIRINPDIDAGTHDKITTGKKENKFGIPWPNAREVFHRANLMPGINVVGLAMHIGSQLVTLEPFEQAFRIAAAAVKSLREDGISIHHLDLGGGLGVVYGKEKPPSAEAYGNAVRETLGSLDCRLLFEPGRLIVADAGVLVARVIYVKKTQFKSFTIVDAAMNDMIRPALYEAYHAISPIKEPKKATQSSLTSVVGPVCESGDVFAANIPLPPLEADDLLAFKSAGAYGAVMSSTYNSRLLVPEVMVNGSSYAVVRSRPTYDDLINNDSLPPW